MQRSVLLSLSSLTPARRRHRRPRPRQQQQGPTARRPPPCSRRQTRCARSLPWGPAAPTSCCHRWCVQVPGGRGGHRRAVSAALPRLPVCLWRMACAAACVCVCCQTPPPPPPKEKHANTLHVRLPPLYHTHRTLTCRRTCSQPASPHPSKSRCAGSAAAACSSTTVRQWWFGGSAAPLRASWWRVGRVPRNPHILNITPAHWPHAAPATRRTHVTRLTHVTPVIQV
jgi:hypothetical protein